MSNYKTDQCRLLHRGKEFHFVSYEAHEANAARNEIAAHVPEELKQERLQRFMTLQAEISASKLAKKIGKVIEVMVEDTDEEGIVARSQSDAPNIDGMVFVDSDDEFLPGDFLDVRVTDSTEHDLYAVDLRK